VGHGQLVRRARHHGHHDGAGQEAATTQPTATYIQPDPTNPRKTIEWRYTWNGTAWGNPVRV